MALDAWLDHLADVPTISDLSLCHGEFGILDALATVARRHDRAAAVLEHRAATLPRALAHGARLLGTPSSVPTPGLMYGLAGAGYGMLRTGFAAEVPSVLTMQTRADLS